MEYLHLQQLISASTQSTEIGYAPFSPLQQAMWYEYLCKHLAIMFFGLVVLADTTPIRLSNIPHCNSCALPKKTLKVPV